MPSANGRSKNVGRPLKKSLSGRAHHRLHRRKRIEPTAASLPHLGSAWETPVLQYHFNWKTISVAAAMTLWSFYFQIFEKAIAKEQVVEFLAYLVQQLPCPLLIVWDRLPAHRSRLVAEFVALLEGQIELEYLPALRSGAQPGRISVGSLEASPTAERLSQGSVAAER